MIEEEAFIEKIHYLYDLKRYKQVIELCMKYLYVENEYIEYLYSKIIESNLELKLLDKAEKFVNEALKKFPNNSYYHALLTRVYLERMNYTKALKEVNIALNLAPNDAYLFYLKALILNNKSDYNDAEKMIEIALNQNSNNINYMYTHALILYNIGNDRYKKILTEILVIDPNNSDAIYLLGMSNKSFSKKKNNFLKALRLNPFSKEYQSALQSNKRDLYIYLLTILIVVIRTFLIHYSNVPSTVMNIINIFLVLSVIHLSYYSFQTHFLITIAILPYCIDEGNGRDTLLIITILSSIVISYFLKNIATFIKSSVISILEASSEAKNVIKYFTKEDIPVLFVSNISKLLLILLTSLFFVLSKYEIFKIMVLLIIVIPIYIVFMKKKFTFTLLMQSLSLLMLFMFILNLSISGLPFPIYCILALFMAIIYTETIRRIR